MQPSLMQYSMSLRHFEYYDPHFQGNYCQTALGRRVQQIQLTNILENKSFHFVTVGLIFARYDTPISKGNRIGCSIANV